MGPCSWLSLYQWLYGMNIERTTVGISKAEDDGGQLSHVPCSVRRGQQERQD